MYVLLGANGNITSRVSAALLDLRQPVRVIGRNPASLEPLRRRGAELAIGATHATPTSCRGPSPTPRLLTR